MPDKVRPTVPEAVRAFIIVCGGASDVWERLERFIQKLGADSRWAAGELEEARSQIIERLTV